MGSSENEGYAKEKPQHSVSINHFYMGKFPVTQAQWKAVAAFPQVQVKLKPEPCYFQGANQPVERVSWMDAVEFCQRLSRYSNRKYNLPSESEWEYACRASTTSPFNFGPTITPDLANYNGNYTYGSGPKGMFRTETTEVGSFPPNSFGLYDMHGNVWEWCKDIGHESYKGAPKDGSTWIEGNNQEVRVLRGGSWLTHPNSCRSANRLLFQRGLISNAVGFRVVCFLA
jgi:formylglycine-generating enzyme required for sulfatase activity